MEYFVILSGEKHHMCEVYLVESMTSPEVCRYTFSPIKTKERMLQWFSFIVTPIRDHGLEKAMHCIANQAKTTEILTQWFLHAFKRTLFFFFLSELLFQTANLFHQLRQMRERSLDSPPLGVGPRRKAQVGAWGLDGADDAGLASEDSVVTDGDMAIHAGLSGHDDVIADLGAAGDANLRAEEIVLADLDIMSQMAKIIDLGAAADDGVIHRTVVDGGAGADLDVVSDDSATQLTDVMMVACLVSGEAESLTADDGMRTKDDAVA